MLRYNYYEQTSYLKVWLRKASRHGDHGSGERAGDADSGQELRDVRRQAERNGPIGVKVARGVVDVEAEVGDVQLPGVLMRLKCVCEGRGVCNSPKKLVPVHRHSNKSNQKKKMNKRSEPSDYKGL